MSLERAGSICAAEEDLALLASGDLEDDLENGKDAASAGAVRAHVGQCARCQERLADFRSDRRWLQRQRCGEESAALPPSLAGERALAELQRRLSDQLEEQRPLPPLLARLLRWWEARRLGRIARAATGMFSVLQPMLAVAVSIWLVVGAVDALTAPPAPVPAAAAVLGAPSGARTEPATVTPEELEELADGERGLRIEMHTQDPNVRIIWFAANEPARSGGR